MPAGRVGPRRSDGLYQLELIPPGWVHGVTHRIFSPLSEGFDERSIDRNAFSFLPDSFDPKFGCCRGASLGHPLPVFRRDRRLFRYVGGGLDRCLARPCRAGPLVWPRDALEYLYSSRPDWGLCRSFCCDSVLPGGGEGAVTK